MIQKLHTIKVFGFSSAYDICSVLDCHDDIAYTVNAHFVPDKFGPGHIEYEIIYSYLIDCE